MPHIKMSFTKLPVELLDIIASKIPFYGTLYALARTSRLCATVVLPHLYRRLYFGTVPPIFMDCLLLPDRSDAWKTWVREINITLENYTEEAEVSNWTLLTELLINLPANRVSKIHLDTTLFHRWSFRDEFKLLCTLARQHTTSLQQLTYGVHGTPREVLRGFKQLREAGIPAPAAALQNFALLLPSALETDWFGMFSAMLEGLSMCRFRSITIESGSTYLRGLGSKLLFSGAILKTLRRLELVGTVFPFMAMLRSLKRLEVLEELVLVRCRAYQDYDLHITEEDVELTGRRAWQAAARRQALRGVRRFEVRGCDGYELIGLWAMPELRSLVVVAGRQAVSLRETAAVVDTLEKLVVDVGEGELVEHVALEMVKVKELLSQGHRAEALEIVSGLVVSNKSNSLESLDV